MTINMGREDASRSPAWRPTMAACLAASLWVFWPSLVSMDSRWSGDPRYSHGYLVPLFSAGWLWTRRAGVGTAVGVPSAWGLALILGSVGMRMAGAYAFFEWAEAISLLPCVAGLI